MGTLGNAVCKYCGKTFERVFGMQAFCSEECRKKKYNEKRRAVRRLSFNAEVEAEIQKRQDVKIEAKYVSIKDAALMLGVSRPTIYRRIEAGELHPLRVSSRTVRVSLDELLQSSKIQIVPNNGDFSIPISIDDALVLYRVSRTKFFVSIKKAGIRPKYVGRVAYFPKLDLDRIFPAVPKYERSDWYSVDELAEATGMAPKSVCGYVRKHNISKIRDGKILLINKKEWDAVRFSKGDLNAEYMTVGQAVSLYRIGKERFYSSVNAAGIEKYRDGRSVYFRKKDLDRLFCSKK